MKAITGYMVSYIKRTDYVLWLLCFAMSCLSIVLIAGILDTNFTDSLRLTRRSLLTQSAATLIGMILAFILSMIDYRDLARLWKLYVPACYLLLLFSFFLGVGTLDRPDDKRWLIVPGIGFHFQPSELLRSAFIVVYAYHIYKSREDINNPLCLLGLFAHGLLPVLLLYFQGDAGAALIFAAIIISMLFCAGISWRYIIGATALTAVSLPLIWNYILDEFQKERMRGLFFPTAEDLQGVGFQQFRAEVALAMGGREGRGIFNSSHIYIPEMHNDFMFSFLGESMGFVGCLFVIAVMLVIWFKILHSARGATDLLGCIICVGVFAMLSFQSIINIGMNISLLPVIGNTLPFLSCGGSSMLTSYIAIGLVLSVYMHSEKSMFE
ncbi:MAG: FtsW/RodA/SpoVE family cell cycle protein [Oscillospiraceae bacterium]|nr:FtsW/RodA/SpoVE family cell cycle protein [Oscillospiraceae bacterium]